MIGRLHRFVEIKVDSESGIATLSVRAFVAEDSHRLASAMMRDAEALVNRLNGRLFDDALRLANKFADEALMCDLVTEHPTAAVEVHHHWQFFFCTFRSGNPDTR